MNQNTLLSLSLAAVSALALLPVGVAVSASIVAAAGILAIAFGEYKQPRVPVGMQAAKRRAALPLAA